MNRLGVRSGFVIILLLISAAGLLAQEAWNRSELTIARIKYRGGGDWYNDPCEIPNLLQFVSEHTNIVCAKEERYVDLLDDALFTYPILFITGHGRIDFSPEEAARLRLYLVSGGFLYADDDYGMDKFFRAEMKKVFPESQWLDLPFQQDIFHNVYEFPNGIPKIHEHDGGPGKAYGLFYEGRMVAFYTFNTNISDGWADPEIHNDPEEVRQQALRMGANIVVYAITK